MATLTVSLNGVTATVTYSITSTNTQSSCTPNVSISPWTSYYYTEVTIGGTVYDWDGDTEAEPAGNYPKTATWTRTTSAKTATLKVTIYRYREGVSGWELIGSNSNTATLTIPALASWNVTYNANGHGTAPATQTKYYGVSLKLASAITATGYSFVRWNTASNNTGTSYAAGSSYTANAALQLYAIWNHTITYNANTGSGAPTAQTALATSAITISSTRPTKAGYLFNYWAPNANGTGTPYYPGGTYPAGSANITLYAVWTKAITEVTIGSIKAIRTETASALDKTSVDDGTCAYIKIPITVTGAAAATISTTASVVADSGANPTIGTITNPTKAADTTLSSNVEFHASNCNTEVRYTFTITVTANNSTVAQAGVSATKSVILSAAFFTMDFRFGGKGVHFGGPATENGFFVSMSSRFNANVSLRNLSADTSVNPSSNTYGPHLYLADKNGVTFGYVRGELLTSGAKGIGIETSRSVNDAAIYNGLHLRIDASGNRIVAVNEAAPWRAAIGAVNIAGDTMTGNLHINKSLPYVYLNDTVYDNHLATAAPASSSYYGGVFIRDKNGSSTSFFRTEFLVSRVQGTAIYCHRKNASDEDIYNMLRLNIDSSGNRSITVSDSAIWRSAIEALGTEGGTLTGNLSITKSGATLYCHSTTLDSAVGQTIPASGETQFGGVMFQDMQGANLGWFRQYKNSNDRTYTQMTIRRVVGNDTLTNGLTLGINADGTRYVGVSEPAPWRTAIGALSTGGGTLSGNLTISKSSGEAYLITTRSDTGISAGFGVGSGGTNHGIWSYKQNRWIMFGNDTDVYLAGVNYSSQTANKVLASPNGSTGAASFRALVAADIPNLNASKITAGTLAIARGGTGTSTGIKGWTLIASSTGTTKATFSPALTDFTELLVVAWYSTTYLGTAMIPTANLGSTEFEFYLAGGASATSASSIAGRRAACKITSTYITPLQIMIDGVGQNGTWRVYAR